MLDGLICHAPRPGRPDDVWWIGFDCAHGYDVVPGMPLLAQLINSATYKDIGYVRAAVTALAQQLS